MSATNRFDEAGKDFLHEACGLLAWPTSEGAKKRTGTERPVWQVDPDHLNAAKRHLQRYLDGETADETSGCHPLVHAAWRLLAVACNEVYRGARYLDTEV